VRPRKRVDPGRQSVLSTKLFLTTSPSAPLETCAGLRVFVEIPPSPNCGWFARARQKWCPVRDGAATSIECGDHGVVPWLT